MISILSADLGAVLIHNNTALPAPVFRSRTEAEAFLTWLDVKPELLASMNAYVLAAIVERFRAEQDERAKERRHAQIGAAP